jgi:hypothetical protein
MSVSVDGQHCEFLSFEFADESLAKLFSLGHNTAVCYASNEGDGGRFLSAIRAGTFRGLCGGLPPGLISNRPSPRLIDFTAFFLILMQPYSTDVFAAKVDITEADQ